MDYHQDRFCDHSLIFFKETPKHPVAVLPLSQHQNTLISHGGLTYGGLIITNKTRQENVLECFRALSDYLKTQHFERLVYKKIPFIYSAQAADEDRYALWKMGAKIFKIEASSTIALKEKLPTAELKRRIKRAARENITLDENVDFEAFVLLLSQVLKERHNVKPVHSAEELKLLHGRFPDNIRLFTAKKDNEIIAATLLFIYPDLIHTQYLAANETARQNGALDFLIAELIYKFQNEKRYFDFGISTENNGQILNTGLIHQKEGFGARTVAYETWEWII